MSSYLETKRRLHLKSLSTWPTTLTVNGRTTRCLATPKGFKKEIRRADLFPSADTTFSLMRDDYALDGETYPGFTSLNIAELGFVESVGKTFQVFKIIDDDDEPTVDLQSNLKV